MPNEPTVEPDEIDTDDLLDEDDLSDVIGRLHETSATASVGRSAEDDGDDISPVDFLSAAGIQQERDVPDIIKPWMRHHNFVLVKTVEEVNRVVDEALATGHTGLDLETEGLDNRIVYDGPGRTQPRTVHQIVGYCLSPGDGKTGYYIPVRHQPADGGEDLNVKPLAEVEAAIRRLCQAAQPTPKPDAKDPLAFKEFERPPQVIIDFWHASFDQEFLYPITGIDFWHPDSFEDGYLASFVKYSGDKNIGLKGKSRELLKDPEGHPYEMIEIKELFPIRGQKIEFHRLAPDEPGVVRYACSDAICTRLLCADKDLVPMVRKQFGFMYRIEKQVAQVKRVMERYRVKINQSRIQELQGEHRKKRDEIRKKIIEFAASKGHPEFEPGSPSQLSALLFSKEGLDITLSGCGPEDKDFPNGKPPQNEKSKQYKTGADVLEELAKAMGESAPPILKWILAFREEDKMLGTYLDSLANHPDENCELRFQFKQTGAATGRFSAPSGDYEHGYSGVPIHGIPGTSDLRTCFVAREGYTMVKCDYAGEELRIVTNLSNEKVWVKEFLEGSGDLHSITARAFFGKSEVSKDERKMGKVANFALVYGGGPAAVMRATGCDRLEGTRRKQAFDKAVPDFAKWVKVQHAKVKKDLGVWTAFGRWIAIPDANSIDNAIRAACERHATNYPIQGSGADIMKIGMILIHKELYRRGWLADDSVRLLLTVHDELVFEIRHDRVVEAVPVIVEMMELPTRMAGPPHSPKWPVPLVTEPLVGPTWGTGYPCERAKPDHKLHEGEVIVNGFAYGTIRSVDLGKDTPVEGEVEHYRDEKAKKVKIRMAHAAWLEGHLTDEVVSPKPPVAKTEAPPSPPTEVPASTQDPAPIPEPGKPSASIVTMHIRLLTRMSVDQVRMQCARYIEPDTGSVLRVIDPLTNQVLVDPRWGIRVDVPKLTAALREANLLVGDPLFSQ